MSESSNGSRFIYTRTNVRQTEQFISSEYSLLPSHEKKRRLKQFLQRLHDRLADLLCARLAAKICGPDTETADAAVVEDLAYGVFDSLGLPLEAEGIPEEHGRAEDRPDGVGDAFAGYVRGGAVDGFVEPWRPFEVGRGRKGGGSGEGR
jgi:hypothetical protein